MKRIATGIASILLVVAMLALTVDVQTAKAGIVAQAVHDLAVVGVAPSKTIVGQGFGLQVDVAISNLGDYPEALDVTLYANATAIATFTGETLPRGASDTVDFSWDTTGVAKGNYTFSAVAEPVQGEIDTANNHFTGEWVVVAMAGDLIGGTDNVWDFVPDGTVNMKDVAIVVKHFYSAPGNQRWNSNCDINNDGLVDSKDIAVVAKNLGETQDQVSPGALNFFGAGAVYVYGRSALTDSETSFVADHFGLLDVGFEMRLSTLQSIKSKNPSIRILAYRDLSGMQTYYDDWTEVNSHEDWFIHDVNGNRVIQSQFGWYLMDPASGWRQHYASYLNSRINSSQYDGVFADDVWDTIPTWPSFTSPYSSIKPADVARWHNDVLGMLQYVKANLPPGKLLIINTNQWATHDYLDVVDGKMDEGFAHATWQDFTWFDTRLLQNGQGNKLLNALARDMAAGKIVWCASGAYLPSSPDAATLVQVAANVKYCYAAFLCALNGTQGYFGFNSWSSSDVSRGYYPVMDTDIGEPTGAYYLSQNVFVRDFTGGKVLLNPSWNSYTVSLGGNYRLLDGTLVSSVVLNPWSGEILPSTT